MALEREEFYLSEEAAKAKVLDLANRGRNIKSRLVALDEELRERVKALSAFVQAAQSNLGETLFRAGETTLDILRPYPPGQYRLQNHPELNTVASLPREHFNGGTLWVLIEEINATKQELKRITAQLSNAGIALI